jgi:hypothetical protein
LSALIDSYSDDFDDLGATYGNLEEIKSHRYYQKRLPNGSVVVYDVICLIILFKQITVIAIIQEVHSKHFF